MCVGVGVCVRVSVSVCVCVCVCVGILRVSGVWTWSQRWSGLVELYIKLSWTLGHHPV